MQKSNAGKAATDGGTEKSMGGGGVTAKKPKREEDVSNLFTVELTTLLCEFCFLPFQSHVYTCNNGHAACAKCCASVGRKCSFCGEPIGDSRCRAMEKILAGITRPCKFSKNGCPETVRFTKIGSHEDDCRYTLYLCPFDGCAFIGLNLYGHILEQHATAASTMDHLGKVDLRLDKGEPLRALLQSHSEIAYLLFNGGDVLRGRSLSVVRGYPQPEPGMPKELATVVGDAKPGSLSLTGTGVLHVKFLRRQQGFRTKSSLLVPDALCGGDTVSVTVKVHI